MFFKKQKTIDNNEALLGGRKVKYHVKFSKRRSIEIRIDHNKELKVAAPIRVKISDVEKFLHKKSEWIIKALKNYDLYTNIPAPKNFESGEAIYFLGQKYNLVIRQALAAQIELHENEFIIHTPYTKNKTKIRNQIIFWYKNKTGKVFNERLGECLKLTRAININYSDKIEFRKMHRRWGTCTADNKIILSSNLIFLDLKYIDYVILHELCHFKQKNHGAKYYALLLSVCPNYKNTRKSLNNHIIENFL